MKVKFMLLLLSIFSTSAAFSQNYSVQWAMFHGCETHCGIYPSKNYQGFNGLSWKFKTAGKIFSSPAVFEGVVYVGSEDKNLYAIDVENGNLLWRFKTGGAVHSSPAVFKNTVYFGSYDGYYYALDTKTGKEKWKFKTGGEKKVGGKAYWTMKPADMYMEDLYDYFLSSPVINKDDKHLTVYFGSSDGNMYALDAESGELKWKFKTNGIVRSSPALADNTLYFGSWDTYMYALDAYTGKEKWKFKTGDDPQYHLMEGIESSPAYDDGAIYFGSRDGYFYALDAGSGKLVWKYSANGSWVVNTAAVKDRIVYFGTSDSFLFLALDAKTGKEKYHFKANGYLYSSPAIAGNALYFGDYTGKLYALNLNSGERQDEFATAGRKKYASEILNKEGNIDFSFVAGTRDASLYQTSVEVMNELYQLGPIVSSPAIVAGTAFFGSADGYLYALNLKESPAPAVNTASEHHH
ncbi:PQQ-binding-like beta-propeller repeat protein [Rubrolithibacter danxiaensis]|uniref:outer membrane protein assembly factor BamB family protein n=1 Tax=Rubrolithibacter danxiaensis TaxID=3390805 RepID=UPI003BF82600